jgi:putative transposase
VLDADSYRHDASGALFGVALAALAEGAMLYAACLEIYPERPSLVLVASIISPVLSSILGHAIGANTRRMLSVPRNRRITSAVVIINAVYLALALVIGLARAAATHRSTAFVAILSMTLAIIPAAAAVLHGWSTAEPIEGLETLTRDITRATRARERRRLHTHVTRAGVRTDLRPRLRDGERTGGHRSQGPRARGSPHRAPDVPPEKLGRLQVGNRAVTLTVQRPRTGEGVGSMKRSKFSEEQIAYALRQAESGTAVADVCRQLGVSEATFCVWKKKFAHLGVSELRRMRSLEEENTRLKQVVADLTLDKHMLAEAL